MTGLITGEEQAKLLSCTSRHLRNLCKRRLIPYVKLGRSIRFNPNAVERAVEKLTIKERI